MEFLNSSFVSICLSGCPLYSDTRHEKWLVVLHGENAVSVFPFVGKSTSIRVETAFSRLESTATTTLTRKLALYSLEREKCEMMAPSGSLTKKNKDRGDDRCGRHRSPAVLSVEGFAHRKGTGKALQGFRKRKEQEKLQTAKALREYRKVMKQEGYEPGKGAGRKRAHDEGEQEENGEKVEVKNSLDETPTNNNHNQSDKMNLQTLVVAQPPKRHAKTNPFHKTVRKATQKRRDQELAAQQRETREKERLQKLKERRKRTKLLTQRSRKGQPIMKNLVQDMLQKLEKDGTR